MRNYPILTLTEKGADFLRGGHVWVFADEVTHITGTTRDVREGGANNDL